jgi:putative exporter of polyketide antibiotics
MPGGGNIPSGPHGGFDLLTTFVSEHATSIGIAASAIVAVQVWRLVRPFWKVHSSTRKLRLEERIAATVRLSRTQTAYVGACLAKRTVTVTLQIFGISIALNALNALRTIQNSDEYVRILEWGLLAFAGINACLIVATAAFVLTICQKIVRQIEEEDKEK